MVRMEWFEFFRSLYLDLALFVRFSAQYIEMAMVRKVFR